jgi:hypothetical protein
MNVKSCFLPKLENYSEFTKQIVMEVEDSVVNLPNPEIKEAAKYSLTRIAWAYEMRTRGNERVSVRQGYGYGCRYGTLNEANLLKTARTCCSLEATRRTRFS